jgi:hypothetical protein
MRQPKPVLQDSMQPARLQRKIYVEGSRHHAPFFISISDGRRTSALAVQGTRKTWLPVRHFVQNSRYKDGTSWICFFTFLAVPNKALQSDRCLVITTQYSQSAPFHGGNTGSNPVGDASLEPTTSSGSPKNS